MRAEEPVPQSEVLAVVAIELEVMFRVMRRAATTTTKVMPPIPPSVKSPAASRNPTPPHPNQPPTQ